MNTPRQSLPYRDTEHHTDMLPMLKVAPGGVSMQNMQDRNDLNCHYVRNDLMVEKANRLGDGGKQTFDTVQPAHNSYTDTAVHPIQSNRH